MKKFLLVFILGLMGNCAFAGTTYLAGIDEAIQLALQNSGELRTSQARFGITEAQIFTANTRLNPVLISDNGFAEHTYRAGIQFIVETASKRKKRTILSRTQHEITKNEINIKTLDIKANVRKAYIDLYAAQEKQKAAIEIINTVNTLLEATQKKFIAGSIPQLDVVQIEIIKINAENDLQNAKLEIRQAHNRLNLLLGHCLDETCVLETPVLEHKFKDIAALEKDQHNLNIEQLRDVAFVNRPELKLSQNNIELAKNRLSVAKANRVPNLLIAAGPDIVTKINDNNGVKTGAFIIGAIDIPIFDRQKGPIKEALAQQQYAEKEYDFQKNIILNQINDSYLRIISNTKIIEKYKSELLPKAENIVLKSKRSFEEGKDDIIVPLLAQEAAIKVKFAYIKAVSEYQTAVSDLERAIGTSL